MILLGCGVVYFDFLCVRTIILVIHVLFYESLLYFRFCEFNLLMAVTVLNWSIAISLLNSIIFSLFIQEFYITEMDH
jgi:hypothetical protein